MAAASSDADCGFAIVGLTPLCRRSANESETWLGRCGGRFVRSLQQADSQLRAVEARWTTSDEDGQKPAQAEELSYSALQHLKMLEDFKIMRSV